MFSLRPAPNPTSVSASQGMSERSAAETVSMRMTRIVVNVDRLDKCREGAATAVHYKRATATLARDADQLAREAQPVLYDTVQ